MQVRYGGSAPSPLLKVELIVHGTCFKNSNGNSRHMLWKQSFFGLKSWENVSDYPTDHLVSKFFRGPSVRSGSLVSKVSLFALGTVMFKVMKFPTLEKLLTHLIVRNCCPLSNDPS